jgi:hypothetical protein
MEMVLICSLVLSKKTLWHFTLKETNCNKKEKERERVNEHNCRFF